MNGSWYPNTALPAWTLAIMAVVAMATLSVWLIAVYLADRSQSRAGAAAAARAGAAAAARAGAEAADTAERPVPSQRAA
ncbi:MAG: hypothetical protein JO037_12825 [Actinobacteria bacterium]|nr:hypothetical protein [Actinomycetota bacterium]